MRHEPVRCAFSLDLFRCLAESQRLGLGEHIREENIVVTTEWIERLVERYEVAGNESRSLMDLLVRIAGRWFPAHPSKRGWYHRTPSNHRV